MSDVVILTRWVRGDVAALGELFARHAGAMYEAAAAVCGRVDAGAVVRDVLLGLADDEDFFDMNETVGAGLCAASHRLAVDRSRLDRQRNSRRARAGAEPSESASEAGALDASIRERLATLSRDERDAVALAYQGHTYREVASLMRRSESSVLGLLRDGLGRVVR